MQGQSVPSSLGHQSVFLVGVELGLPGVGRNDRLELNQYGSYVFKVGRYRAIAWI